MSKISMSSTNSIPAMDGCFERIGSLGPARSSCRLGKLKVSVKRVGIDVSTVLSIFHYVGSIGKRAVTVSPASGLQVNRKLWAVPSTKCLPFEYSTVQALVSWKSYVSLPILLLIRCYQTPRTGKMDGTTTP